MSEWDDKFSTWAKGPQTTEQTKCENAEIAIRKALAAHEQLSTMDVTVFAQGSYRNRTNVKQDSDVDICARLNPIFFPAYPPGKTSSDFGNRAADFTFATYKQLIHDALVEYFGRDSVSRGDKAFNIHANTYRIDADVVPVFTHKRYSMNPDGTHSIADGIAFDTDAGKRIINWPEQHYENGLWKHNNTARRYRKMVRILKRLRNVMQDEGITNAQDIASCLIEALVWNVPNDKLNHETYLEDVRHVLAHAFNNTLTDETCSEWREVSELKYLFRSGQPWTRQQAHNFVSSAWNYVGFQ